MIIVIIVVAIVLVAVRVLLFCPATHVPLGIRELHAADERSPFMFLETGWLMYCSCL